MASIINQLIKKISRKFLVPNICHIEVMKGFRDFTVVNTLG